MQVLSTMGDNWEESTTQIPIPKNLKLITHLLISPDRNSTPNEILAEPKEQRMACPADLDVLEDAAVVWIGDNVVDAVWRQCDREAGIDLAETSLGLRHLHHRRLVHEIVRGDPRLIGQHRLAIVLHSVQRPRYFRRFHSYQIPQPLSNSPNSPVITDLSCAEIDETRALNEIRRRNPPMLFGKILGAHSECDPRDSRPGDDSVQSWVWPAGK